MWNIFYYRLMLLYQSGSRSSFTKLIKMLHILVIHSINNEAESMRSTSFIPSDEFDEVNHTLEVMNHIVSSFPNSTALADRILKA